jgi:hypothetical protein
MDSRQPRHRPLAFVGFVVRTTWPQVSVAEPLTETHEGFAGGGPSCLHCSRTSLQASAQRYNSTLEPREAWWI